MEVYRLLRRKRRIKPRPRPLETNLAKLKCLEKGIPTPVGKMDPKLHAGLLRVIMITCDMEPMVALEEDNRYD